MCIACLLRDNVLLRLLPWFPRRLYAVIAVGCSLGRDGRWSLVAVHEGLASGLLERGTLRRGERGK